MAQEEKLLKVAGKILETNGSKGREYLDSPVKRRLDLITAGAGSGLSLPVTLVCAAVVAAADRHNPFIRVTLPGFNEEKRSILKIQTMIEGEDWKSVKADQPG